MPLRETRGLTERYGSVVAVDDLTISLAPGVTGPAGSNGAGRSTLIHLLSGFLPPSAGTVTLACLRC